MRSSIKAGIVHFAPVLGDLSANRTLTSKLLSQAADAELLVLPELSNSGYNFINKDQAFELSESVSNSPYVDLICEYAAKNKQYIVAGLNERDGDKLYNTAILAGPEGIIGKYRKMHLFWNEFDFFEKGDLGLPVFDLDGCKTGILICFDWIFPEVWRILTLKGAELICHPSNLVLPYAQQAVPVQCMMNRIYAITSNRYGVERGLTFSGRSFMSNPKGETIYTSPATEDDVYICYIDLELARQKMITPRNHVLNDRLADQYRDLTSDQ